MNDLIQSLSGQLKGASGGTRAVAVVSTLALAAILGLAAWVANRPDYQLAFSGLSDYEVAKVNKALSESGIPFQVSQPPAPFSVYVDEGERSAAYMAVYGAGALDKPLKGILAESGVASVFNSAEERQQGVRKREWAEMEMMLEELDFVVAAHVRTSPGSPSAFATHKVTPLSASVTLSLVGESRLTEEQAETVAELVSRGLGVEKQRLVISDQSGNRLYGGEQESEEEQRDVRDLLAHQAEFDRRSMEDANAVLATILGPNKARVVVSSEWDFDRSTLRTETPVGKGTLLEETKNTSERPLSESEPRPAGISSNVATSQDGGRPQDGNRPEASDETAAAVEPPVEKTSEERKQYRPTLSTEERVRFVPALKRLSVALFLDASIDVEQTEELARAVKASVGFDEERDAFESAKLAFFAPPEESVEPAPAEESSPNPLVGTLLRRGVEIVSALAFVLLLLKSLKMAAKDSPAEAAPTSAETAVDPELLARAHVEELLKSDPKRVGAILSSWVRGEGVSGAR